MLKLLIAASCVLATCQAFWMPPTGMGGGMMGNGGARRRGPGIIRFGPYSIDITGQNNLEMVCNSALMAMGGKVSDHLSDVMGRAVRYILKQPGQNVATLGGTSKKWQCLVNAATSGGMNPGNAANGVADYFDTAAEFPLAQYMPPGMPFNPCQMVFCGEKGMTPANMMLKMMQRLQRGQSLGPWGARVFGQDVVRRMGQRSNLMSRMGAMANPMGRMGNILGTLTNNMGTATNNAGTPANNAGTPANNAGTPTNNAGTPTNNAGAPANNMGTASSSLGTARNNAGTSSTNNMGTSGTAGTNPWMEMMKRMSGFGQSSGLAGMMNAMKTNNNNNNPWAQMAAAMMGGNKAPTTRSGFGSGGNPMLQNMMRMMAGRFNPASVFNPQSSNPASVFNPQSSNPASVFNPQSSNSNAAPGMPGMGTFAKIMNAMNTMSALERMQDPPEHGRSPFMGSRGMAMPTFNPMGGVLGGLGNLPMGGQMNGGLPAPTTGNTGSGGAGTGMGMLADVFRMLG